MSDAPPPAKKRSWINIGEVIALAALVISGLGLWKTWHDNEKSGPTEVVEKRVAIPLVLRGRVEDDGQRIVIEPVESSHSLESLSLTFAGGKTVDVGGDGELSARDVESALPAGIEHKGDGRIAANVAAGYVEAGKTKGKTGRYLIRYRWEGGGMFSGKKLRLTGFARG